MGIFLTAWASVGHLKTPYKWSSLTRKITREYTTRVVVPIDINLIVSGSNCVNSMVGLLHMSYTLPTTVVCVKRRTSCCTKKIAPGNLCLWWKLGFSIKNGTTNMTCYVVVPQRFLTTKQWNSNSSFWTTISSTENKSSLARDQMVLFSSSIFTILTTDCFSAWTRFMESTDKSTSCTNIWLTKKKELPLFWEKLEAVKHLLWKSLLIMPMSEKILTTQHIWTFMNNSVCLSFKQFFRKKLRHFRRNANREKLPL